MKRTLSLVLALIMVLGTFSTVFAAATAEEQDAAAVLEEIGVLLGNEDGELMLENNLKRRDSVVLLSRLLGEEDVAAEFEYTEDLPSWADVDSDSYYLGYLAWAEDNGYYQGDDEGNFKPNDPITAQQFLLVLFRALGYEDPAWGEEFELAEELGLLEGTDLEEKDELLRGAMSVLILNALGTKMYDSEETLAEALEIVMPQATMTVEATGAKKLTVKFSKAVDTAKAELSVKKGSIAVNVEKVTFSEDKKEAVIETTTKLTKTTENALYTVTVKGLEEELTATTSVQDEKVEKIEVVTTTAPMVAGDKTKATLVYKVLNQYGEDVTSDYTNINWTFSTGDVKTGTANGQIIFANAATAEFIPGTKVYVTGVYANTTTGNSAVANAELTIGLESKADKVEFKGIYQANSKKFDASFTNADGFKLLYTVLDQYGNEMPVTGTPSVVFTNNNPLLLTIPASATATQQTVDGKDYFTLAIEKTDYTAKGGNATIMAISSTTGKQSTYDISLEPLALVRTFTMSSPAVLVAAGETVEIPFTALDQNGNQITKYNALNGKVRFTPDVNLRFVQKSDGNAKLEYTAPSTSGLQTVTSFVLDGGNFSSLTIDVKVEAVAKVIIGLDSTLSTNVSEGATLTFGPDDLVYQDQHGRVMDNSSLTFGIYTTTGNTDVRYRTTIDGTVSAWTDFYGDVDFYNADLTKLEFALFESANPLQGSNKVFNVTVSTQDKFVSYEVADPGIMYNDGDAAAKTDSKYDKQLKVYGVKADGTKVLLANKYFEVTSTAKLDVSTSGAIADVADLTEGYAAADFEDKDGNAINLDVNLKVTIKDVEVTGAIKEVLTKAITLSNAAPKGDKVTMKDIAIAGRYDVTAGTIALSSLEGKAVKEVKDQYGVVITATAGPVIKNVTKVAGSTFAVGDTDITGAVAGDKFTAEFKYGSTVVNVDFVVVE